MQQSEVKVGQALEQEVQRLQERVAQLEADAVANAQIIKSLQDYTRRYQLLVQNLPVFFIAFDQQGLISAWNRECERMTGYEAKEVLHNPDIIAILFPDLETRDWVEGIVSRFTGSFHDLELKLLCKNGDPLPVSWYCVSPQIPLPGWSFWCIGVEVSTRRHALDSLREYRRRLSTLMHNLPGMAYRCANDQDYSMEFVSSGCIALTGYQPEDLVGNAAFSYGELVHPDDREMVWREVQDRVRQKKAYQLSYRIIGRSGQEKWVWEQGRAIEQECQGREVLEGFISDITDQRKLQEEQRKLEDQMRQTQKLESLGALAGGVAHDFNNLLMGILGNAELALMDLPENAPARFSIREIEAAGRKAADLTRQMLSYSGKNRFINQTIHLNQLIEEMQGALTPSLATGLILEYDLTGAPTLLRGDPAQIRQMIVNLITNASEAIGDEGGHILVRTGIKFCSTEYLANTYLHENLPSGQYAYLEVSDSGPGIEAIHLPKIFDPFFSTKFTGRGLGLATVLGIVRSHNGAIDVLPSNRNGATFLLFFPVSLVEKGVTEPAATKEPRRLAGKKTILLVDDEAHIRALGTRMLERKGYLVLTANDGRQALEVIDGGITAIDCVILDLTMPHMDGETTFQEIRRRNAGLPIVLSSGYEEDAIHQRFEGQGLAGFLQKPYRTDALYALLENIIH